MYNVTLWAVRVSYSTFVNWSTPFPEPPLIQANRMGTGEKRKFRLTSQRTHCAEATFHWRNRQSVCSDYKVLNTDMCLKHDPPWKKTMVVTKRLSNSLASDAIVSVLYTFLKGYDQAYSGGKESVLWELGAGHCFVEKAFICVILCWIHKTQFNFLILGHFCPKELVCLNDVPSLQPVSRAYPRPAFSQGCEEPIAFPSPCESSQSSGVCVYYVALLLVL